MKLVIALTLAACVLAHTAAAATFRVIVPDTNPSSVTVRAEFKLQSDKIGMYITRSPQLDDGQAALVRNLRITSPRGGSIENVYLGGGDWQINGVAVGEQINLEYEVALEHDRYAWGPGIDEVAYKTDDGLFFTGFSLFILPGMGTMDDITVQFELPSGWKASTPWPRVDTHGVVFQPDNFMDLGRNALFMGSHLEETITVDEFTFIIAIGGDLKAKKQLFIDTMTPVLPAYVEMFGGMPNKSRYLVVINPGSRTDGGAFIGSYSMLISGEVNTDSRVVWGHGISHELLHFWNGLTIMPASRDEEWFKEGFTDYLTLITLSREGLDPRDVTYRKLENMARRYLVAKLLMGTQDSMRTAGANKHKNRFLVYGGGTLVAFALDVRVREATGNARGLDDVMAEMYAQFGTTGDHYDLDDIVRVASAVSGEDQSEFFARYVDGTDVLDVTPYFTAIGLQLTNFMDEFYISKRADATPAASAMARSILGPGER